MINSSALMASINPRPATQPVQKVAQPQQTARQQQWTGLFQGLGGIAADYIKTQGGIQQPQRQLMPTINPTVSLQDIPPNVVRPQAIQG